MLSRAMICILLVHKFQINQLCLGKGKNMFKDHNVVGIAFCRQKSNYFLCVCTNT